MAGKLKIIVLYDRWEPEEDSSGTNGKAPLVRTLDKKEVEEEVVDALTKLGHEPTLHQLDGSLKSLHALPKLDCDIIFNLSESFARQRHGRLQHRRVPRARRQALHRHAAATA